MHMIAHENITFLSGPGPETRKLDERAEWMDFMPKSCLHSLAYTTNYGSC
jgi:hypothetical protein